MINNLEWTVAYLVTWIQQQARSAGAKSAVVGISGGVDSAVVFALCSRAMPLTIGVLMPCHSSAASTERGMEVVHAFPGDDAHVVQHKLVRLELAFASIRSQVVDDSLSVSDSEVRKKEGSLRSCLRAPTLDFVAKLHDGLVYGTGNRDEDEIFRYYNKRGDGAVDNNVLATLHKSEVYQLARYLGVPQSVIDAPPTADLWGPDSGQEDEKELGITYDEIEWVTRHNDAHGTVNGDRWLLSKRTLEEELGSTFTERQWFVLARARVAHLSTLHKEVPPPHPKRPPAPHVV